MSFDLRWLGGFAMLAMSGLLLWITWRLWFVEPVNRIFRVGPFVTQEGMKALVNMRLLFFSWGLFLATQGINSVVFWFIISDVYAPVVTFIGSLASGFGFFAIITSGRAGYWLWRGR